MPPTSVQPAPVAHGRRHLEEQQVAPRHKVLEPCVHGNGGVARQRRVADLAQHRQIHHVVVPRRSCHCGKCAQRGQHLLARLQLHMVALAVVKTNGLDPGKALQRPGQAHGGILTTRKQNEGVALAHGDNLRQAKTTQPRKRGCAAGPSIVLQAMVTAIMASKNIMMPPTTGSTTGM
jgi:hypothetical protein